MKQEPSIDQPLKKGALKRKKCRIKLCKGNMTFKNCIICKKKVRGKCLALTDYTYPKMHLKVFCEYLPFFVVLVNLSRK